MLRVIYFFIVGLFFKNKHSQLIWRNNRILKHYFFPVKVNALPSHAAPGTMECVLSCTSNLRKLKSGYFKMANLGAGATNNYFSQYDIDVVGFDIEPVDSSIRYADFNLSDELDTPKQYDLVVAQEIVEHLENPWLFFRKVRYVLKDDGSFILTTPNTHSLISRIKFAFNGRFHWFEEKDIEYHVNPLFKWEVEYIANKSGFILTKVIGNSEWFFSPLISNILASESLIYEFRVSHEES